MTATVEAYFDEYARRYSERDTEGVADMCLWPFLAIREGVPSTCRIVRRCEITMPP